MDNTPHKVEEFLNDSSVRLRSLIRHHDEKYPNAKKHEVSAILAPHGSGLNISPDDVLEHGKWDRFGADQVLDPNLNTVKRSSETVEIFMASKAQVQRAYHINVKKFGSVGSLLNVTITW